MAVRAIDKAVEAFRRDKSKCSSFRPRGAVIYDQRILGFKGLDKVSLWALGGRMILPLVYGEYQRQRFDRMKGQADLIYRGGKFFLLATADLPDKAPIEIKDFLGVDLGIVNIATDSDGGTHSGETVKRVRRKHHRNRKSLQRKGTKGSQETAQEAGGPGRPVPQARESPDRQGACQAG
jgi:transposase